MDSPCRLPGGVVMELDPKPASRVDDKLSGGGVCQLLDKNSFLFSIELLISKLHDAQQALHVCVCVCYVCVCVCVCD